MICMQAYWFEDASSGDDDIQAAELSDGRVKRMLNFIPLGNIRLHKDHLRIFDSLDKFFCNRLQSQISNQDPASFAYEDFDELEADAGASASDERSFASDIDGHCNSD